MISRCRHHVSTDRELAMLAPAADSAVDPIRACHQSEAAKTLGIKIPQSLLLRADEVIE